MTHDDKEALLDLLSVVMLGVAMILLAFIVAPFAGVCAHIVWNGLTLGWGWI